MVPPDAPAESALPVIDPATFVTAKDVAATCGVKATSLVVTPRPAADPATSIYLADVMDKKQRDDGPFLGIGVNAADSAAAAAKAYDDMLRTAGDAIEGTAMFWWRNRSPTPAGWIRRELWGLHGRVYFTLFETDPPEHKVVCDDDELVALATLIDSRL
jgi:hypothetical protein